MGRIENTLTFLTEESKKEALQIINGVEKNLKMSPDILKDKDLNLSVGDLLRNAAYQSLLNLWPANEPQPEDFHEKHPWCNIEGDEPISGNAVAFVEYLEIYFNNGERLRRISRFRDKEIGERKRKYSLSEIFLRAWRLRDQYISTPEMYVRKLVGCDSGTSFSGPLYFPIGAILECWINCPEFRLDDGRFVIRCGSGLSGFTSGEAINLNTGNISSYECSAYSPHSRSNLFAASEQYRRKAVDYLKSGVLPGIEQ